MSMKTIVMFIVAAALAGLGRSVLAADVAAASGAAPASTELTDGEVRKVDAEGRKLTLRHAEIRNLGMPGMTMVFQVADPALLAALKVGDKVRFRAEKVNGALTVTRIEAVK